MPNMVIFVSALLVIGLVTLSVVKNFKHKLKLKNYERQLKLVPLTAFDG